MLSSYVGSCDCTGKDKLEGTLEFINGVAAGTVRSSAGDNFTVVPLAFNNQLLLVGGGCSLLFDFDAGSMLGLPRATPFVSSAEAVSNPNCLLGFRVSRFCLDTRRCSESKAKLCVHDDVCPGDLMLLTRTVQRLLWDGFDEGLSSGFGPLFGSRRRRLSSQAAAILGEGCPTGGSSCLIVCLFSGLDEQVSAVTSASLPSLCCNVLDSAFDGGRADVRRSSFVDLEVRRERLQLPCSVRTAASFV